MQRNSLILKAIDKQNILSVIKKHNKKSKPGLDNISWADCIRNKEKIIENIANRILNYEPMPLVNKYYGDRKVVVPTVEERILQLSIVKVLNNFVSWEDNSNLRIVKGEKALFRYFNDYKRNFGEYVAYSDVLRYSESIRHDLLICFLTRFIKERDFIDLIINILQLNEKTIGLTDGHPLVAFLIDKLLILIDENFHKSHIIRFHDDYFFFSKTELICQNFLTDFLKVLNKFHLQANVNKTKILKNPLSFDQFYG